MIPQKFTSRYRNSREVTQTQGETIFTTNNGVKITSCSTLVYFSNQYFKFLLALYPNYLGCHCLFLLLLRKIMLLNVQKKIIYIFFLSFFHHAAHAEIPIIRQFVHNCDETCCESFG